MNKLITIVLLILLSFNCLMAQGLLGIKTNLLYDGVVFTPNLGAEIGLDKQTTLDIVAGYNPWNLKGNSDNNKKLVHFIIQPGFKYFLCERFNGHFFGVHALYSQYNISGHELPMLFGKNSKKYRFQGNGYGAGISYGYQFMLGIHWNLEFEIGVGYAHLDYDKYNCYKCSSKIESLGKNYFGPTKAGISLIYIIK